MGDSTKRFMGLATDFHQEKMAAWDICGIYLRKKLVVQQVMSFFS